jgi:hypothetical protein
MCVWRFEQGDPLASFFTLLVTEENTCVDQGPSPISWSQPKKWERRERREKREKMEKVKKEGKNYVCDQTHSLVQVHTSLSL